MNGLLEKAVDNSVQINSEKILIYYEQVYNNLINSDTIYPIIISEHKKEKLWLLNKADALYHIACISLKSGYIRRSLKYFVAFRELCLWLN